MSIYTVKNIQVKLREKTGNTSSKDRKITDFTRIITGFNFFSFFKKNLLIIIAKGMSRISSTRPRPLFYKDIFYNVHYIAMAVFYFKK